MSISFIKRDRAQRFLNFSHFRQFRHSFIPLYQSVPAGLALQNLIWPTVLPGLFLFVQKSKHREIKYKHLIALFVTVHGFSVQRFRVKSNLTP